MGQIRVADGTLVDPYNLTVADVKLDVLAHSVSQLNRFTGHIKYPFSVGQHTLNVAAVVNAINYRDDDERRMHVRAALIHDLSEAWFNDMSSPVKAENPDYKKAEKAAGCFIAQTLGVPFVYLKNIDLYDKRMYKTESRRLFPIRLGEGMGDDRQELPYELLRRCHFEEISWREVRDSLFAVLQKYFPDHTPTIAFWDHPNYG